MMKYMIYILVIFMLSVSASCVRDRADDCKLPSRLVSVDSLMQRDPQAALDTLVGGTLSGTDLGDYYTLLVSEALFKTYNEQQMRGGLMEAMHAFDSLHALYPDSDGYALLSARSHYMNGVGYYENDSLVPACQEYLTAIDIMERHFDEDQLVGYKAKLMALTYGRLGDLFSSQYMMRPAIDCQNNALHYCSIEPTSKYCVPRNLYLLGLQYDMLEQFDSAMYYYDRSLQLLDDTDNIVYKDIFLHKNFIDYRLNGFSEASLEGMRRFADLSKDDNESITWDIVVGHILYSERRYEEAKPYLEAVMKHSEDDVAKVISAEYLYKINGDFGNRDEEAGFAKYLADNKKLNEADKALVSELNYVYEANRHRDEKRASAWQITLVISIIIAVGLIILFAYGYNKRMRIANVSTTETSNNKEEQENEVVERSFYDEPICKEILGIVKDNSFKARVNYKEYKEFALDDKQFLKLRTVTNLHYNDLTNTLKNQFPELTIDDVNYCCLYLLGLKTADISALMHKEYSTTRYRKEKIKNVLKSGSNIPTALKTLQSQ